MAVKTLLDDGPKSFPLTVQLVKPSQRIFASVSCDEIGASSPSCDPLASVPRRSHDVRFQEAPRVARPTSRPRRHPCTRFQVSMFLVIMYDILTDLSI